MASVDRDVLNALTKVTDVHAGGQGKEELFDGEYVFGIDAFAAFALQSAMRTQSIDGAYGRGLNYGRGVVGEGGDMGPGVVGIAGKVIASQAPGFPRNLWDPPFPGRAVRAGVIGLGADPAARDEPGKGNNAIGVLGSADAVGVFGRSRTTGVVGDASAGQHGVEGVGSLAGVYGHVDFANPNPDGAGVLGAAAADLQDLDKYTGRAGVFVGPVDVIGKLTVTGDQVVWGAKSAAAKHTDGSHRLLYCVESPESQFEDFGEARLVGGAANVKLDRDFAAVADLSQYHVFLTPYGDSNGLYVANRSRSGFQVREQGGGKSSVAFSYRVVAKRRHVATKRFQKVTPPNRPKLATAVDHLETASGALGASGSRSRKQKRRKGLS
jgi:hypothetical protein